MMKPDYFAVRQYRAEVPFSPFEYPLTSDRDGWIAARLAAASRILEVGAGERPFLSALEQAGFSGTFRTMDVANVVCDFRSFEEIREQFDAIVMREVVEHLPRETFYDYLDHFLRLLAPSGKLAITTPNPWAPQWFLAADFTHVSAWPPHDLYAILRYHGFSSVEIMRVIWPSRLLPLKRLYWALHSRFYQIDYAGSYVALATLPNAAD